jgi:hypothetical protein
LALPAAVAAIAGFLMSSAWFMIPIEPPVHTKRGRF